MKNLLLLFALCLCTVPTFSKSGSEIIREHGFKAEVAPMLATQWTQDGGENFLLPMVSATSHAKTGCGATAMAQVMRYWACPARGTGQNYYIWDATDGTRNVLYADFGSNEYEWEKMIPLYKNNPNAAEEEVVAVARLMADIGVALEMKFQASSTATNIEYISTVLKKYFGYNPSMTIRRYINGAYSMDEWLTMIYRELSEGRPVIMGGAYGGASHIFVADGYNAAGEVHLNLGKASIGSACNVDGYYDLTRTGQTYNEDMRMLIGISPEPLAADISSFHVAEAGTLKDVLGGEMESQKLCMIRLSGKLNAADIAWLKKLSAITTGQLSYIDMRDAEVEGSTLAASAFDTSYTLQEIMLPSSLTKIGAKAFRNCYGLWKVTFGDALKVIDSYAFSGCRYLEGIEIPSSVTSVGNNPFRYGKLEFFSAVGNPNFKVVGNVLLDAGGKSLYSMPVATLGEYAVAEGVEVIKDCAFLKQCMLESLTLPESLTRIEANAFLECLGLREVYCHAQLPPTITDSSFDNLIHGSCTVHVPKGQKSAYEASSWKALGAIVDDIEPSGIGSMGAGDSTTASEYIGLDGINVSRPLRGNIYLVRQFDGRYAKILYRGKR